MKDRAVCENRQSLGIAVAHAEDLPAPVLEIDQKRLSVGGRRCIDEIEGEVDSVESVVPDGQEHAARVEKLHLPAALHAPEGPAGVGLSLELDAGLGFEEGLPRFGADRGQRVGSVDVQHRDAQHGARLFPAPEMVGQEDLEAAIVAPRRHVGHAEVRE